LEDHKSRRLFPNVEFYHQLLAIKEVGAPIEYRHQRGFLTVENHTGIERRDGAPIRYRCTEGTDFERLNTAFSVFELVGQLVGQPAQQLF
jgi:hypothetical protein